MRRLHGQRPRLTGYASKPRNAKKGHHMTIGTKSSLYGAHSFLLHPLLVAIAWTKLYGFPWDPRLMVCFILHDVGYFGCTDMDGATGSRHPERGARIIAALFGEAWGDFCLFHSRSYATAAGAHYSKLCVADKYATALLPIWLATLLVSLTGEIDEYIGNPRIESAAVITGDVYLYSSDFSAHLRQWVEVNRHNTGRAPGPVAVTAEA